jgi:hypothetical protein
LLRHLAQSRRETLLPRGEGRIEIDIAIDAIQNAHAAKGFELRIQIAAELAEVLVVLVAQRANGIVKVAEQRQMRKRAS